MNVIFDEPSFAIRKTGGPFDQGTGFLHDIGGIEPQCQPLVQPRRDHPPQPIPMLFEQGPHGSRVASGRIMKQRIDLRIGRRSCVPRRQRGHP